MNNIDLSDNNYVSMEVKCHFCSNRTVIPGGTKVRDFLLFKKIAGWQSFLFRDNQFSACPEHIEKIRRLQSMTKKGKELIVK